EDGIRYFHVTGVQTCALPICFFINKDGTVDLPAISSEPSNSNKFALLATLAKGPKWMPGIQNGRPMRVGYILAVNFDTINQVPEIGRASCRERVEFSELQRSC